jgi:hypothetical protein
VNAETVAAVDPHLPELAGVDELLALDTRARRHAAQLVEAWQR